MNIYSFNDYDKYNSLKAPFVLFLLIAYSMRHGLLWLGVSTVSFSDAIELMNDFTDETYCAYFLCGIQGVILLIALINRQPKAGKIIRWIWRNGKNLLASSLALHLIVSTTLAISNPMRHLSASQTMFFLFDVIGFIYLYRSQRMRDIFADFPSTEPIIHAKSGSRYSDSHGTQRWVESKSQVSAPVSKKPTA